jgi:hypothetical protein
VCEKWGKRERGKECDRGTLCDKCGMRCDNLWVLTSDSPLSISLSRVVFRGINDFPFGKILFARMLSFTYCLNSLINRRNPDASERFPLDRMRVAGDRMRAEKFIHPFLLSFLLSKKFGID